MPDTTEYKLINSVVVRDSDTGELIICEVKHLNINIVSVSLMWLCCRQV